MQRATSAASATSAPIAVPTSAPPTDSQSPADILRFDLQRLLPNAPLLLLNQVYDDQLELFDNPRRAFLATLRDPRLARWVHPKLIAIFEIKFLYPNLPYQAVVQTVNQNWIPGRLEESVYRANYQLRSQLRGQRNLGVGRATVQRR